MKIKTKFPKKPKGKMSLNRQIAYTQKYLEAGNKMAEEYAAINGITTEVQKLSEMRKLIKENAKKGKITAINRKFKNQK